MAIEMFEDSGDAYDASNCRLESGTVLVIESECVVGLAWAWPIAITAETGKFHQLDWKQDTKIVKKVLVDAMISWADVKEAYGEALRRGWAIEPWVAAIAAEREWDEDETEF